MTLFIILFKTKWHGFCVLLSSCRQRNDSKIPESGATSDEENEDGDFTVYECPGLAPVRAILHYSKCVTDCIYSRFWHDGEKATYVFVIERDLPKRCHK